MSNTLDVQISDRFNATNSDFTPDPKTNIRIRSLLDKHKSQLGINADLEGYESTITGVNLPRWIQPLHFERNLNLALDALKNCEHLIGEMRSLDLALINENYIRSQLQSGGDGNIASHNEIVKRLNLEDYRENIALRFSKQYIDLIEFSKAARLGGQVLFNFDYTGFEVSTDLKGLSRIREFLNQLLDEYRIVQKDETETVIPISLKYAKNNANNLLCDKWEKDGRPNGDNDPKTTTGLDHSDIRLNLKNYTPLAELDTPRIRRVGFTVLDKNGGISGLSDGKTSFDQFRQLWDIQVSDESNGIRLGQSATSPKMQLQKMVCRNVEGTRDLKNVAWVQNKDILNVDPRRSLKVSVKEKSHNFLNSRALEIYDIIMYLHVAHFNA